MKRLVKKHSLAVRWFHWINFPLLTIMIWSGLMIYWASSDERFSSGVYRIGWGDTTLFHFFPKGFWDAVGLGHQLAKGMSWHFFFGWFFAINGILYVIYTVFSGEWRLLVPTRHSFSDAFKVVLHDLHLRKDQPPFIRYNGAQRIAYTLVILMGGMSLLTGLAIYRPAQLSWLTAGLGGYAWARWEHFWLTIGYVLFFVIHIAQVIRAGWVNFRSMVAGYDLEANPQIAPAIASDPGVDDLVAEREMRRRTRRGFLVGATASIVGYVGWRWLMTRPQLDGIPGPLRNTLRFNERLSGAIFSPPRNIVELPVSAITANGPRVNGNIGLNHILDLDKWRLHIAGTDLALTLADLHALPQTTQITPLNCIEGWTTVARWTGVRFADFVDKYVPDAMKKKYVSLTTPDGKYYVGLDIASALHSQTLLCYAINNEPLSNAHGAPLRLLIPTKYGIKNLKRVGVIKFSDERPADYWAEDGYDWFAGL